MDTNLYDFQIRVLLSEDDGQFVAHALEMDLVAYGKTEKEATKELNTLVRNQMSFAIEKQEQHLMYFRAPDEYFEKWEKAQAATLKGVITQGKCATMHVKAVSICFSQRDISEIKKHSHSQRFESNPLVCA
jgi:hypothetical protein